MSNWAELLPPIKEKGEMISFYPADLKFPMVAPKDIGEFAAQLMTKKNTPKLNSIQGPEKYSPNDVAVAFSKALDKNVEVKVIPKDQWREAYKSMGFSEEAAESYSRMTEISLNEFEKPTDSKTDFIKGKTTIQEYIANLVKK